MSFKIVTDSSTINKDIWSAFVFDHPDGNIYHTPEMVEVYKLTLNYEPVVIFCLDGSDQIAGVLVAVVQKEYKGILGKLTSRSIILGGPLVKNNSLEVLDLIINYYNKKIKNEVIYTQIRNQYEFSFANQTLTQKGFIYEDHLNILIDLTKPEDQLWKELHTKRRNEIRKAKKDVIVNEVIRETEIRDAYLLLTEVYQRAKLPLAPENLFVNAFNILGQKNYLKAFGAYFDGRLIGSMFVLCYKGRLIDWYAGSDIRFYNKYPNDIIPWEIFIWGIKNNYHTFDFNGAGKPGVPYGVRDYKAKFGGNTINPGRFQKNHHPFIFRIAKLGFRVWQYKRSISHSSKT